MSRSLAKGRREFVVKELARIEINIREQEVWYAWTQNSFFGNGANECFLGSEEKIGGLTCQKLYDNVLSDTVKSAFYALLAIGRLCTSEKNKTKTQNAQFD